MQFILTKQIAVEADTPEEAASKDGKTISLNVQARPQPVVGIAGRSNMAGTPQHVAPSPVFPIPQKPAQ